MHKKQLNRLKNRCSQTISSYHRLGSYVSCGKDGYTFIDHGSNVLGVAHLDTVQQSNSFYLTRKQGELIINSPKLDDRLGVYTLLDVLPSMGLNFDVLLTENEESAQSTAIYFESPKQYNWIFEFDRCGETVVMYQYDTPDLRELMRNYGYKPDIGLYSDIADLDLGCVGFNFPTGYYEYHSLKAYCVVSQWQKSVSQFVKFFGDYHDTFMPFDSWGYDDLWLDADDTFCSLCQTYYTADNDIACIEDTGVCCLCNQYLIAWSK